MESRLGPVVFGHGLPRIEISKRLPFRLRRTRAGFFLIAHCLSPLALPGTSASNLKSPFALLSKTQSMWIRSAGPLGFRFSARPNLPRPRNLIAALTTACPPAVSPHDNSSNERRTALPERHTDQYETDFGT
jgi:hypothetical protein